MIRALLAHRGALARGVLSFVLRVEGGIDVVAEADRFRDVPGAALVHRPDVTVLDVGLLGRDPLPRLWALRQSLPGRGMLVLTEARRSRVLESMMAGQEPGLGFLATDGPPARLLAAVHKVAGGEPVLDPELVVSAVRTPSPLTPREAQVLAVAAEGASVVEISERLELSPGTVRNHLSRVIGKLDARTRIEAIKLAQDAGWI